MRILRSILVLASLAPASFQAQPLIKSAMQVDAGNTKTSGNSFAYRLTYNCSSTSGPCLGAEVIDLLPAEVQVVSTIPASPAGDVAAIQTTPNFMGSGRTRVRFDLIDPLPAGNSGDLVINVRFPNGTTPDGTVATNTADAVNLETAPGTFTTPPVDVTAVASTLVNVQKTLQTAPANLDLPESYRLRISVPNSNGALNLTSVGPVTDVLPPGTVFNGATPSADCQPGCVGTTPATITWSSPCAVPLQPNQSCDISVNVTFPSGTFPSGTNVTNSFTADATPLGESPQTFGPGQIIHPVTTFVPNPGVSLTKNMANGTPNPPTLNQTFSYDLDFSNDGNVPLDNMVLIDTLPVELQVTSVATGAYAGASDFAAGEGVRVSYEKNTAPGIFTLWGSSPNTSTNTTLTSPPPGLGAGESITRIRWELGQAAAGMSSTSRPLIRGQIINPDNAGGPVAFGDLIQNCANLTSVYTAGPTNVNRTDCESFTLSGPFVQLNPAKDNLSGGGPFNPGQSVSWRLRVRSDARSSDPVPLADLTVTDLLPLNLLFSSWTFDDQGTALPAPQSFEQIPNFAGTGRTLLRWRWNAGSGNLGVNQQVWINVITSVRNGATAGALSNDVTLDSDASGLQQRCSGASQSDALDLDGDGDTAETLCRATGSISVAPVAQLISGKTIQGTCDSGSVTSSAGTLAGGSIEYLVRVQNVGTVAMQNFVMIDILPFVGDTGVRDTTPRGSQWTPLLSAPIDPPSGTTIFYSTSGNPCRGEVGGPTTGCDAPNWTSVIPDPITSVRSFKIEFGNRVVNPFDFLELTFPMTAPANLAPGDVAYNSFAYQAERADGLGSLAAEPMKVGISLGSCEAGSIGDYVWVDTTGNGLQDDGPTGLNGVTVLLLTAGSDGIAGTSDDVPHATTVTANGPDDAPGWYTFPGLPAGDYFVRVVRPPAYEFAPRDAGADTTDSDVGPLGFSHVFSLAMNEDVSVDAGLVPTAFGAVGDYVWFDLDGDGMQNGPLTSGINGSAVHLYLDDGDSVAEPGTDDPHVASASTADDAFGRPGHYVFENLVPGLPYFLQFDAPASAAGRSPSNAGGETEDSDAGVATGTTQMVVVAPLETNRTLDAGFLPATATLSLGDQVWFESDDDGVFEPENGETGIDGVRLDLYRDANGDGEPTLGEFAGSTDTTTVSGFEGRYQFRDLAPGTYIVVVHDAAFSGGAPLAGMTTSHGNDPASDPDDDVNGDDNGTNAGALIASRPITLTNNGEPTSEDGNNDSNLTLDFGFTTGSAAIAFDYGDAPDAAEGSGTNDYRTTALDDGARHRLGVAGAPWLGQCADSDGGFLANAGATADDLGAGSFVSGTCSDGDDEDGVAFTGSLTPGTTHSFDITAGGATPCLLDAWIDWNRNGAFGDSAGEQIASSVSIAPGPAFTLSPAVPAGATPGTTYARFRCSTAGGLAPDGEAADGEVEDYLITIIGHDFGDAPASYGDASHIVDPLNPLRLGSCVDVEGASQSSVDADGDDISSGTSSIGTCFDDEDGISYSAPLVACMTSGVTAVSSSDGLLSAWIDFNGDGDFSDSGEQIFSDQTVSPGSNPFSFNVPCTAATGATHSRYRLTESIGIAPSGAGSVGEVEDHRVAIGGVDFGDASDTYQTLLASNGAVHVVTTGFSLGATVDEESDGQPSINATGDGADEDGIVIPATLIACSAQSITVMLTNTAGVATPRLDAWIDFDGDGTFEAAERIATALALTPGANSIPINVPCNVSTTATSARLRLSSTGVSEPGGVAVDGEVEDYGVTLNGLDFGDAADPTYPTLLASNGARHVVILLDNPTLGSSVDTEMDGAPGAGADGDDVSSTDDENGVTTELLATGATGAITLQAGPVGGLVSCWIDFDSDGDWSDTEDQIVTDLALAANSSATPTFAVPADAVRGSSALRCRMSSLGGLTPAGPASDGEVEDHIVEIAAYDFGDAPVPHPTLLADDGARHLVLLSNNPSFGASPDTEPEGQPSIGADGDDALELDDEDGVMAGELLVATTGSIGLTAGTTGGLANCWIDFNDDGDWSDAGEQIVTDLPIAGTATVHPTFAVPADSARGSLALRCRMSTVTGLPPTGFAPDGEIEDHLVTVSAYDFGDAPAPYATLLADDGARHLVPSSANPSLGAQPDPETDGASSPDATGDDASGIDDEDGVTLSTLVAAATESIAITTGTTGGTVSCWIDFNADGDWSDAGEQIVSDLALGAGTAATPSFAVPHDAARGETFLRCRISTLAGLTPTGIASDGEVEDHLVQIVGYDFGDAPAPYATLAASAGARHELSASGNPTLGAAVDAEADGQPSATFAGDDIDTSDDEDGVTIGGPILPASSASIDITSGTTGGIVSCWIDFNGDGDWNDAGEHVVNDLAAGTNATISPSFPVPATAVEGTTGLRCRISTLGGLTPDGDAADGEVEDYAVIIGSVDFGDAPDSYGTSLTADGARHGITTGFTLGATVDAEADGQPTPGANGDGADEDGVVIPAALVACSTDSITVMLTNTAAIATPLLDAWIDFDGDGTFEATERIATALALTPGANSISVDVPCSVSTITTSARFRLSSTGVSEAGGGAIDGEVEDYSLMLNGLDFGDASDPTYPTFLASNGARHVVKTSANPTLGPTLDTEGDAASTADATGDDTTGSDDEDGISFPLALIPTTASEVVVTTGPSAPGMVSVWIDFNHDGDWLDAGEQVVADVAFAAGSTQTLPVDVPPDAIPGDTAVRARIATETGLATTGLANDGEVEDHVATILAAEPRIGVALDAATTAGATCGIYDLMFDVVLTNAGNVPLSDVQATMPLATFFTNPATISVSSIASDDVTVDASFDGVSNTNLLLPGVSLTPGQTAVVRVGAHLEAVCTTHTYYVSVSASGQPPTGPLVTDVSQNGADADPDADGDPTNDDQQTPVAISGMVSIPTLDPRALLALVAILAAVAFRRMT